MKLNQKKTDEELELIFKEIMDDRNITALLEWYKTGEASCDFDLTGILEQNKNVEVDKKILLKLHE